jgi:glycosyltransferase involved in cell wall biosynthesis
MPGMPTISAIVCTYNRCRILADALQSLAEQSLDTRQYEVLVVDNASTDDTARVVFECQQRFTDCRIRLIREDAAGLSNARNRGFREARGRYVAYLDDDALAAPEWLAAGLDTFEAAEPQPLAVVGPVFPRYPDGKPNWFNDRFETYDLGPQRLPLGPRQTFMGGNAMYRRSVLDELGGFDPQLGMNGNRLWLGEEVELLMRMRATYGEDCPVYYDPRVSILHAVGRDKLNAGYILRRRFLNGQCVYWMKTDNGWNGRVSHAAGGLAWIGWLSFSAALHTWRYRSWRSWVTERGAPIMSHLGQLLANVRGGRQSGRPGSSAPQANHSNPINRAA